MCSVRKNKARCDKRKGTRQQFGWKKGLYLEKDKEKEKRGVFWRLSDSIHLGNSSFNYM